MRFFLLRGLRSIPLIALLVAGAGCAGALDSGGGAGTPGGAGAAPFALAPPDSTVHTVQLHPSDDEGSVPAMQLGGGRTLTLQFDLVEEELGRPLSIYFYHLDRNGRRDLVPSEFLRGFLSDDLRDWRISGATTVRYSHYTYTFPNNAIEFTRSGLYVLRVAEQGNEDRPLFERHFVVSEEAADVRFAFLSGLGLGGPAVQPIAELRPGEGLGAAQVYDYTVCFARLGRLDRLRCTGEPSLLDAALYRFALPREDAFEAPPPIYSVDLGVLRASPQVVSIDYAAQPPAALLELDYERFGDEFFDEELLTGQPLVQEAVLDVADPRVDGEYIATTFRYVPEGERPQGLVWVVGSFNAWRREPAGRLRWNSTDGRYEGTLLLKQGRYAYRYETEDRSTGGSRAIIQPSYYTALVFLRDPVRLTDRLVAVRNSYDEPR